MSNKIVTCLDKLSLTCKYSCIASLAVTGDVSQLDCLHSVLRNFELCCGLVPGKLKFSL